MRRVLSLTLGAIVLACLMAAPASRWVPRLAGYPEAHRTIEPSLPVTIDLRIVEVSRRPVGGMARLEASVDADGSASGVEIALRLPEGVTVAGGDLATGQRLALGAAGHHFLTAFLRAGSNADLPIEIEASFRLPDGTPMVTRQGVTLRVGRPAAAGREHLGAYEVMAVPAQDLVR